MALASGMDVEVKASEQEVLDSYHYAAESIRFCLQLGDQLADYGNARGAADYLVGALDDLGPQLALLTAFLNTRP
jgi:hypothetical protein